MKNKRDHVLKLGVLLLLVITLLRLSTDNGVATSFSTNGYDTVTSKGSTAVEYRRTTAHSNSNSNSNDNDGGDGNDDGDDQRSRIHDIWVDSDHQQEIVGEEQVGEMSQDDRAEIDGKLMGILAEDISKGEDNIEEEIIQVNIEDNDEEEEYQLVISIEELSEEDDDKNDKKKETFDHPIDEFITKETTKGSSLRTILTLLKNHSLPEAYGDEIKTEQDIKTETERCARYGYQYDPSTTKKRRRLFMGSLIADDSWHVIATHAAEAYGLYHTVSFIESNTTQTMTKRETRFNKWSLNWRMLKSGIFGPKTGVHVDFRPDVAADYPELDPFRRENLQRSHIISRWKAAGMQPDDVGIICDVDEVFTRDFLLALQSCDVPQFRPGQDCRESQLTGQGLKFEITPDCAFDRGYYTHPDALIGECIEQVGDEELHEDDGCCRKFEPYEGGHLIGKRLFNDDYGNRTMFPLWTAWDIRRSPDVPILEEGRLQTAYHFHNFFDSFAVLRNKYKTFAHARENADVIPLSSMQRSFQNMIKCLKGEPGKHVSFDDIEGRKPILFENESYRIARFNEMVKEMEEDERRIANIIEQRKMESGR